MEGEEDEDEEEEEDGGRVGGEGMGCWERGWWWGEERSRSEGWRVEKDS